MIPTIDVFLIGRLCTTEALKSVASEAQTPYILLQTCPSEELETGQNAFKRMTTVAEATQATLLYSDYRESTARGITSHPTIDYQEGALRDDFDFGALLLVNTELMKEWAVTTTSEWRYAALYDLRLFLSRKGPVCHLPEMLYTIVETDQRASGEKQFDYVDPRNREVQIEMEQAVTTHLRALDALIDTRSLIDIDPDEQEFAFEASVIIPVYNRERTVIDAVESALSQQASFPFNVIVVDNHSTDATGRLLQAKQAELGTEGARLVIITPATHDLGIGGCWNLAVSDSRCGRFAVQLDSDDLYSSPHTLETVVSTFRSKKAAMVIGSYRMCNFNLETLPPGIIDHREWTDENGPNNALRINGLGAPRAFFTPLLRQMPLPNTSYGEDYAAGLTFSRHYRIARIYDELYLCRRWEGNSDAALNVEQVNRNNLYKDRLRTIELNARRHQSASWQDDSLGRFFLRQLEVWPETRQRYDDLRFIRLREVPTDTITLHIQHNPQRIRSTAAAIDQKAISERPCFLCKKNRPAEQMRRIIGQRFELLVNPYPILSQHFTIPTLRHQPQQLRTLYSEMLTLAAARQDMIVFFNGAHSGASAPDHAHLQAGTADGLPLISQWQRLQQSLTQVVQTDDTAGIYTIDDYPCPALLIRSQTQHHSEQLMSWVLRHCSDEMLNVVVWHTAEGEWLSAVFPRRKHRPDCYFTDGPQQRLISPGALDMAGLIITPRNEDFEVLSAEEAVSILRECAVSHEEMVALCSKLQKTAAIYEQRAAQTLQTEPTVSVGIKSGESITFNLLGTFTAKGEQVTGCQEASIAEGALTWHNQQYRELLFVPQGDDAVFQLPRVTIGIGFHWERQQTLTFRGALRFCIDADKVVAINEIPMEQYLESVISSEMSATASLELLKAHAVISRSWIMAQQSLRAANSGKHEGGFFSFSRKDGELIRWYDREEHTLFDVCADDHCQRYQGITPNTGAGIQFDSRSRQLAHQAVNDTRGQVLTYDGELCDARFSKCCGGRTEEFQYCWADTPKPYLVSVYDPFCNTSDKRILREVLRDYDQETPDFYRWTVSYTQAELSELVARKLKQDLGTITALEPMERGKSGRIWKLRIVGDKGEFIVGKELEIRRTLSESHLLSSAFEVERTADGFTLHGSGWGHGVGLCQIGAAVMGDKGYSYDEILLFYYRGAEIKCIYE